MKANPAFSLQTIGDIFLLVPLRDETFHKEKVFQTNEVGALLWSALKQGGTEDSLADAVLQEYDIERRDALEDIHSFLLSLEKLGALLP